MPSTPRPAGLIQRYREELQARHYARHPREMGSGEVRAMLERLDGVESLVAVHGAPRQGR